MGVSNLPRVVAWQYTSRESNLRPYDHESNMLMLNTTPQSQQKEQEKQEMTNNIWLHFASANIS